MVWLVVLALPCASALHRPANGYGSGPGLGHVSRHLGSQRCSLLRCCDDNSLPCGILGVSVTDEGLVALISGGGRAVSIPVTQSDQESVASPEGLLLLQLLQQIDLASPTFPPEALARAAGASDAVLQSVELDRRASFSLSVASSASSASSSLVAVRPFDALALALRYNAPLRAEPGLFEQPAAFAEDECAERFPRAYTRADAKLQPAAISRRLAGFGETPAKLSRAPTAASDADYFAGQGSLDLTEAVAQALPATPAAPRRQIDGPDVAVLRAALGIARDRGDAAAEAKILARLEEVRREEREA